MDSDASPEDRLEAALARIGRAVEARPGETTGTDPVVDEVAVRLDRIIETLRDALGQ